MKFIQLEIIFSLSNKKKTTIKIKQLPLSHNTCYV